MSTVNGQLKFSLQTLFSISLLLEMVLGSVFLFTLVSFKNEDNTSP